MNSKLHKTLVWINLYVFAISGALLLRSYHAGVLWRLLFLGLVMVYAFFLGKR